MKRNVLIVIVVVLSMVLLLGLVMVFSLSRQGTVIIPDAGTESTFESVAPTASDLLSEAETTVTTQETLEESTLDWQDLPASVDNPSAEKTDEATTGETLPPVETDPSPEGLPPAEENQTPWH